MKVVSVIVESKEVILEKAYQYIHWLTTPNEAFSDMPVCPFIEPEIKKDQIIHWYMESIADGLYGYDE